MGANAIMAGEDATESWYVRARGRILGPLSWEQLRALRDRGQLARFDQVSRDRQEWDPADSLERLFPRGGSAGAFVAGPVAKGSRSKRVPEPDSVEFLILDDDAGGPESGPLADLPTAGPPADEAGGWYYADAGTPQGPVQYSELKRLVKDGRIGPATLYWRNGLEQWTSGSDLPELGRLWPYDADATRGRGAAPGQAAIPPRASRLATISLAANLLCGVGNLAAIVVGVVALRQIAHSRGTIAGRSRAIMGVTMGVVGLLFLAFLSFWILARRGE